MQTVCTYCTLIFNICAQEKKNGLSSDVVESDGVSESGMLY